MKFHVFASNKPNFKCKVSDDICRDSSNYDECLKDYQNAMLDTKYTDIYFVCDFGMYHAKPFEYTSIKNKSHISPFMIIDDYHVGEKIQKQFSSRIRTDGFKEYFSDNKTAFEKFLYYYNEKIPANLDYSPKDNSKVIDSNYVKYLADTKDLMKNKLHEIKRYNFDIYESRAV